MLEEGRRLLEEVRPAMNTPAVGVGYRREMATWDLAALPADFHEVVPENWLRRDRAPLHAMRALGRPVWLHGVTLNLGGTAPLNAAMLREVASLMDELGATWYSDHLAASGDAHQLHDLFPLPHTHSELIRVSDRIRQAQDILGRRMAIENPTWYANIGDIPEPDFLAGVADRADCAVLLDLNNIEVNRKNHGSPPLDAFLARLSPDRIAYLHVAGHEWDERFGLHVDTHARSASEEVRAQARALSAAHGWPVLLEWDHDLPEPAGLAEELACLRSSTM